MQNFRGGGGDKKGALWEMCKWRVNIVFKFSWEDCKSQEKQETMLMLHYLFIFVSLGGGGGGG